MMNQPCVLRAGFALLVFTALACGTPDTPPADAKSPTGEKPSQNVPVSQPPAPSSEWVVTESGIGPVRAGMTLAEASQALGKSLSSAQEDTACDSGKIPGAPAGVSLMITSGHIARVDVTEAGVKTREGAQVGDEEGAINALYKGRVRTTPHKYTDGHYLTVTSTAAADSGFRLVFETDGGRVTRYRSGKLPEVEWVEGCF